MSVLVRIEVESQFALGFILPHNISEHSVCHIKSLAESSEKVKGKENKTQIKLKALSGFHLPLLGNTPLYIHLGKL